MYLPSGEIPRGVSATDMTIEVEGLKGSFKVYIDQDGTFYAAIPRKGGVNEWVDYTHIRGLKKMIWNNRQDPGFEYGVWGGGLLALNMESGPCPPEHTVFPLTKFQEAEDILNNQRRVLKERMAQLEIDWEAETRRLLQSL